MKLSARELLKKYKGKPVVDNVSLELSEGETLGLLGPNGAGKTTLFYLITGLLKTDSGSIFLDEKEITNKNISIIYLSNKELSTVEYFNSVIYQIYSKIFG